MTFETAIYQLFASNLERKDNTMSVYFILRFSRWLLGFDAVWTFFRTSAMKTEAVGSCETWFTVCLALRGVAEDLRIIVLTR
jgi:hypothetical protein